MNSSIILKIAQTHLTSRLRQSIVAALGVTFGIGLFIGMIGFMTGVNIFIEDLLLNNTPHIHIFNEIKTERKSILDRWRDPGKNFNVVHNVKPKVVKQNLKDGFKILTIIKKDPNVYGATPGLTTQVFYNFGSTPISGSISGVEILEQDKLFDIKSRMMEGDLRGLLSVNNGVIIGAGLAKKLQVNVNERVNITSPTGAQLQLTIVGIFSLGIAAIDDSFAYAALTTAQKIMGKSNDYITDINIKLKDIDKAIAVAAQYEKQFNYTADDWQEANQDVLLSFVLRNMITYVVSIALLVVAGFGIYNILTMMIYEKMNDIAILKATGFTGGDIRRIFLSEALIIGAAGGLTGILLGFLISYLLSITPYETESLIAMKALPVNFDPKYYIFGFCFALVTTAIAGLMPARRASKVDPITIIRGK